MTWRGRRQRRRRRGRDNAEVVFARMCVRVRVYECSRERHTTRAHARTHVREDAWRRVAAAAVKAHSVIKMRFESEDRARHYRQPTDGRQCDHRERHAGVVAAIVMISRSRGSPAARLPTAVDRAGPRDRGRHGLVILVDTV